MSFPPRAQSTHLLWRYLLASILLLAALLVLGLTIRSPLNTFDEGTALVNASRLLAGQAPYRDYWAVYPPGQYYVEAGLMAVMGANVLITRLYDTWLRLLLVASVFRLGRRLAGRRLALAAAGVALGWLATAGFYSYPIFPGLLLAVWTLLAIIRYLDRREARWLWLAGAGLGLTAFFRLDFGGYTALGIGSALLVDHWPPWGARRGALARTGAMLAAGLAVVTLPLFGYQALVSGGARMLHLLIIVPVTTLPLARHLPYPNLIQDYLRGVREQMPRPYLWLGVVLALQFYLTVPVLGLTLVLGLRPKPRLAPSQAAAIVPVAATGGLMFAQALSRFDGIHVLPVMLFLALSLAWLWRRGWGSAGRLRRLGLVALVLPVTVAVVTPVYSYDWARQMAQYPPWGCFSDVARAGCVSLAPDQAAAIAYLQARTGPTEPIFVGNARHDLIFINDASFYFLSGRPSATYYSEFWPGVVTTAPVQATIISELAAQPVAWVVTVVFPPSSEPNASSVPSGVHLLDDYLRAHYRPCAIMGRYTVWQQGGAAPVCP